MAERPTPYILTDTVVVGASGRAIARSGVSVSEEFEGHRLWITSTGAFSIESMRTSDGRLLTNATSDDPLPSTARFLPQTAGEGIGTFLIPLLLRAGEQFELHLLDTSGSSNTVRFHIEGIKRPLGGT